MNEDRKLPECMSSKQQLAGQVDFSPNMIKTFHLLFDQSDRKSKIQVIESSKTVLFSHKIWEFWLGFY